MLKEFQEIVKKRWEQILVHLEKNEREAFLKIIKKIISVVS